MIPSAWFLGEWVLTSFKVIYFKNVRDDEVLRLLKIVFLLLDIIFFDVFKLPGTNNVVTEL